MRPLSKKPLIEERKNRGAKTVFAGTRGTIANTDPRVTPLTLDVTNASQIQRAFGQVADLDVLINNAGIGVYDDLTDLDVIQKHLDVQLTGSAQSNAGVFATPDTFQRGNCEHPVSDLSSSFPSNTRLLDLEGSGTQPDTIPPSAAEASRSQRAWCDPRLRRHRHDSWLRYSESVSESAAEGILDGVEEGEEDIFPDPTSRTLADGWRGGVTKAFERRINAVVLEGAQIDLRERF